MTKLTNIDWWLGRTAEQRAVKDGAGQQIRDTAREAREAMRTADNVATRTGARLSRLGSTLIWLVTLPILGLAFAGLIGFAVCLLVGIAVVVVRRRRRRA